MRVIILEGITGSGKTTLLRMLARLIAERWRGPVWLATEHVTERVLEPLAQATPARARNQLRQHLMHLKRLQAWDAEAPPGDCTETLAVLERFHLSAVLHITGMTARDFSRTENALPVFHPLLVWCELTEAEVLERSVRLTSQMRGERWNQYLRTLGANETEWFRHFTSEQQRLAEWFERSSLRKCRIHVEDATVAMRAAELFDTMIQPTL
ncbi:MAG TPA: hypothetical protein PKO06_16265 [Candidatus Ozemobacteraceae bacterium]|nr:hypothetical protein [Candidatus Ozemobacteraceae bacterium]